MARPIEILLIEDNAADVALTKAALRGHKLTNDLQVAIDGEQAVQMLRRTRERCIHGVLRLPLFL